MKIIYLPIPFGAEQLETHDIENNEVIITGENEQEVLRKLIEAINREEIDTENNILGLVIEGKLITPKP